MDLDSPLWDATSDPRPHPSSQLWESPEVRDSPPEVPPRGWALPGDRGRGILLHPTPAVHRSGNFRKRPSGLNPVFSKI